MHQRRQAQQASEQRQQPVLLSGKAVVTAVPSGDAIILNPTARKSEFGDPYCYLAYVSVPRVGNPNRSEEPFAHEARETIREMLIGRKVDYVTEYMAGTKKAVSIKVEGQDIASLLVSKALAKANERRANMQEGGLHEQLLAI